MTHQRGYFHRPSLGSIARLSLLITHTLASPDKAFQRPHQLYAPPAPGLPPVVGSREIIGNDENARLSDSLSIITPGCFMITMIIFNHD